MDPFDRRPAAAVLPAASLDQILRSAGLHVTRARLAVMRAVAGNPHSDTESVRRSARVDVPHASRQTIYDALNALTAAGVVRRIQPAGLLARYEVRVGDDDHHHVVCRSCSSIADVDCATGPKACLTASTDGDGAADFAIDGAEVIYWGLCLRCSDRSPTSSQAPHHL